MCTMIAHQVKIEGRGKSGPEWFEVREANVSYDHPYDLPLEHALNIDFVNEALGPGARVAVELSVEAARQLVKTIEAVLAQADQRGVLEDLPVAALEALATALRRSGSRCARRVTLLAARYPFRWIIVATVAVRSRRRGTPASPADEEDRSGGLQSRLQTTGAISRSACRRPRRWRTRQRREHAPRPGGSHGGNRNVSRQIRAGARRTGGLHHGDGETVTYASTRRAPTGSPISCAPTASSASTTTRSSWRTTAATSRRAGPASAPASTTPASTRT